ncbi:isopenicillin N synthase family dioxygenase [Saccharospirillum mangrovi]|uniref:isopenicillin N synthase family dioxygenase n=1 Tax=Saccharospirillum mangrovi TaxID=2161747 RepID=UPI000D38E691|nr:2-oxoglutarate and iron-dependent oxygenase domain-containing protein [Saccharospirillum mangrovi]
MNPSEYSLEELRFESTLGGEGVETHDRTVPLIDLSEFENRRDAIGGELWAAASEVGFFQLTGHGLAQADIDNAFAWSERFFALPEAEKSDCALKPGKNAGWEFRTQKRPSTGTLDQKESYQITRPHMDDIWPASLPDFQPQLLAFERACWELGMKVLSCLAERLGFEADFFTRAHDWRQSDYQSTLRLLHYLPLDAAETGPGIWRAGAHTDFDCLTMVFQRTGQGGLQLCPGKDAQGQQAWTSVAARDGIITCNIGDMLMRWSDDRLKSTLHRVRMPKPGEDQGARYSLAFFCQANRDVMIESPAGKYPPITAADYLQQRIAANFRP